MVPESASKISEAGKAAAESAGASSVTGLQRHDEEHPGLPGLPAVPAPEHYQPVPTGRSACAGRKSRWIEN